MMHMHLSKATMITLRRRIYDKICKNPEILKEVISLFIGKGWIKFTDLVTYKTGGLYDK